MAQTGWLGLTKCFGMHSLNEVPFPTNINASPYRARASRPSAPLKEASRLFLDVASTPPVSGVEWRPNSFTISTTAPACNPFRHLAPCQMSYVPCQTSNLPDQTTKRLNWVVWSSGQVSLTFDMARLTFDMENNRRALIERPYSSRTATCRRGMTAQAQLCKAQGPE
jgi:hypothetical protein